MLNVIILTDDARTACLHLKETIEAIERLPNVNPQTVDHLRDELMDLLTDYKLLEDPAFGVEIWD